jgi:hypothetical protein
LTQLLTRTGRIAFFVHERVATRGVPPLIGHWLQHEQAMLAALRAPRTVPPSTGWKPGSASVVWRLLSGNNREVGRGVGVYPTIAAARAVAERAVAEAEFAEALLAFDRESAHGWCLRLDGVPMVIAPGWHRSRRTNQLNLDTVRATLGRADVNEVATALGGSSRGRSAR